MADIPLTGPIKWSDLRAATGRTNSSGFSASDLNTHNLNQPSKTGVVVASKTRGTPTAVPRRFSKYVQDSIQGLYSMKLANPDYTGPVVNVRRSSDNAVLDFYSDANGTLRDATGQLYSSWIGAATGSVLIWYDQAQNDMAELRYPPVSLASAVGYASFPATGTLSGAPYGNGSYTYTASSTYTTGSGGENVGHLFDMTGDQQSYTSAYNPPDGWNGSTGVYTGSTSTTVSGTAYTGGWVQIRLPYAIYPTGYRRRMTLSRNETSHVFAGSNDGSTWTLLNSDTDLVYTNERSIKINITSSYSYFRLIARTINPANTYGLWSLAQLDIFGRQSLTPTRNALATSASGGNPPQLVVDPGGSGKYVIYFPNGSASASAYYGFTMSSQPTASCMINYRTIYNPNGHSLLCTVFDNQGLRWNSSGQLSSGDGNDFLNPGGYAIYEGTYNATSIYFTSSDGAWHTICASRNSNSQLSMIHIGHCDVTHSGGVLLGRSFYGYMSEVITMSTSLMTLTASSITTAPDYDLFWKTTHIPNWQNGLIASYAPENWTGSQWTDSLGNYNAVTKYGTPVVSSTTNMEGIFTSLSAGAQSGVRGIYSCRRINTNYTGPTFNIRRGSDNVTQDFYANGNGDLGTAVGATGQSLTEWLGASIPYVYYWYDQSGQGRHASQGTQASQPIYRAASKRVDFNTALFLNLPNGTIPMQVPYTFIVRHGYLTNPVSGILGGGVNVASQCNNIRADPTVGYYQYWYSNDISAGSAVQRPENTLSVTFSGPTTSGTTYMYLNGSQIATNTRSGWAAVAGNECLGRNEQGTNPMNGTMYDAWIFATALDGTDRPLIENTLMNASKTLPVLYGSSTAGIDFPSGVLPSTYTLFHLTRYNNNTYGGRIFTGRTQNWLSGHWNSRQGIAFHQGWLQNYSDYYPYPSGTPQWLLSTDQNSVLRSLTMNHALFGSLPADSPAGYYGITYDSQIALHRPDYEPCTGGWANQMTIVYNRTLTTKEMQQVEDYIATRFKVPIPIQEGLTVSLDANEFLPALNGTSWKDRSPYAQNFNLANSVQYVPSSQQFQYMDCTSYGTTFSSSADVSFSTHNTFIWFGTVKNSTGDWRTLLRGYSADHNVIVESGTNRLGLYNQGSGFIKCDANVDISSLDQVYTRFNMHVWKLSTQSPYYQYYFNPSTAPCFPTGIITDGRANLGHGFYALGMWQGPGQYFGQCGTALWYNRELSDEELVETYRRFAPKYDLPSPLVQPTWTGRGQVFTRSGMWRVPSGITTVNILVIAGGGGGGGGWEGGGGGAGGLIYQTGYAVTAGSWIQVIVGKGGYGSRRYSLVQNGENSVFGTATAIGGGAGGAEANTASIYPYQSDPRSGGSGGGASWGSPSGVTFVGSGTSDQGNAGGQTYNGAPYLGGGGGGAGAVGGTGTVSAAGNGGAGRSITIMGITKTYCGGGGGSLRGSGISSGGSGGGGAGNGAGAGYDATYYGSGGGAGGGNGTNPNGGTGFQGIVIVEY
jgi:hypothetical protein